MDTSPLIVTRQGAIVTLQFNRPEALNALDLPMAQALPHWPKLLLNNEQAQLVRNGAWLPTSLFPEYPAQEGDRALLLSPSSEPLALAEAQPKGQALSWAIMRGLWQA